ncbi:hypothetical protein Bca52824_072453 [Brassica carinata]|uniref:Uncharacterized protein n=1 Tax=Brassica carinata TaxID=52824 RepID=A0A8X7QDG6_BRACI|nr:hypothetical protein Bca52824_072453 [Brassica carinata]
MIETNMLLHTVSSSSPPLHSQILPSSGSFKLSPKKIYFQRFTGFEQSLLEEDTNKGINSSNPQLEAAAAQTLKPEPIYEVGELFELSIQLSYLLLLLGLLGVGTFYVMRQVLVRRELDLSAKELQEQVRSGDASATELFELGAVMLRRKFYPAANKFLLQAIQKWDGDDQDLAQVYNALGVSYVREEKLDKGIAQFETAVKLQPGYVTAWNNLGDAYEQKKELPLALKAFEEALLFDPNNKVARPRRDALKDRVKLYKGVVAVKSKKR